MKTSILVAGCLLGCRLVLAQSYTSIKTPTNVTVNALQISELSPGALQAVAADAAS